MKLRWYQKLLLLGCLLSIMTLISQFVIIRWNRSNSLPGCMFIALSWKFTPQRGDVISFDHPLFPAPIVKSVVGVAGDTVEIVNGRVFVNEIYRGRVLDKSPRTGKPLTPIEPGLIPEGYVYVWGSHPESFDSRYADIGLIHISRMKERLWCVF